MRCLYSLDPCSVFRLSPSGLCSRANRFRCPSVRTPPLAPTLHTHTAVQPDVPDCVGLNYTEHTPEGLSAFKYPQHPLSFLLRRYQDCFEDGSGHAWVYYVSGSPSKRHLRSHFFLFSENSLNKEHVVALGLECHIWILAEHAARSLVLCYSNDNLDCLGRCHLVFRRVSYTVKRLISSCSRLSPTRPAHHLTGRIAMSSQ
jgi:hypothetical protein